jgi:hypothetical protein
VRGFSFLVARQHKGNLKSGYGFQAAPSFATIQSVFYNPVLEAGKHCYPAYGRQEQGGESLTVSQCTVFQPCPKACPYAWKHSGHFF